MKKIRENIVITTVGGRVPFLIKKLGTLIIGLII